MDVQIVVERQSDLFEIVTENCREFREPGRRPQRLHF